MSKGSQNLMGKKETSDIVINEQIRAQSVQLIASDGENVGVVSRNQALRMAQEEGLDLVLLAPQGKDGVPVVKIMDHGKALYEKKKKMAEAKKHQKVIQVKEIKIRPKIGEHDYLTKMKHVIQFLHEGKRVKISLFFRGRENIGKEERAKELYDRVDATFEAEGLSKSIVQEKESREGQCWSRIYYLKGL